MRIIDLLQPYAAEITTYIDTTSEALHVTRYLNLTADDDVVRMGFAELRGAQGGVGSGSLLMLLTGPDQHLHSSFEDAADSLDHLEQGGRALLLFGFGHDELPLPRILDALGSRSLQIRQLLPFQYQHIRSGALVERTDRLLPLVTYLQRGTPIEEDASDPRLAIRLANEREYLDFKTRTFRSIARPEVDQSLEHQKLEERLQAAVSEKNSLESAKRKADEEAALFRRRISMVEGSTAFQIGEAAVNAVKYPRSHGLRLPKRIWGLYQGRNRAPGTSSATTANGTSTQSLVPGHEEKLFLSHRTAKLVPRDRLSIAGVWRASTLAALDPVCIANTLLPNDAELVLERTTPHILLIEAAACRAGQPWAFAGTPVGLDRERTLRTLIAAARSAGVPSVFWANDLPYRAPWLAEFARLCDLIVGEPAHWGATEQFDAGLQLAQYNPVDLPTTRDLVVHAGPLDEPPEIAATRRLWEELSSAGDGLSIYQVPTSTGDFTLPAELRRHIVGPLDFRHGADIYRRAALCVAPPSNSGSALTTPTFIRTLEQLACGARVLVDRGVVDDADPLDGVVLRASQHDPSIIKELLARPRRCADDVRVMLRVIFSQATTTRRLQGLVDVLGVPCRADGGSAVTVLVPDVEDVSSVITSVINQTHRPAEVVVGVRTGMEAKARAAWAEATGLGISVRPIEVGRESNATLQAMARAATSPWLSIWSSNELPHDDELRDLVVGAMFGGPDVVGWSDEVDAAYVADLDLPRSLIRRRLLEKGTADPAAWHRRGHRLLGLRQLGSRRST